MKDHCVAVYCGSSSLLDKKYYDAARALGAALARAGMSVVSGGGRAGLMAAVIDGALEAGGETIGVIPSFMVDRGWDHPGVTRMIVTDSMHERKVTMARMSRASIALPGGVGTLDELSEVITLRQLGLYQGHVIILNTDHYYNPLLEMLDRMIDQHFMNPDHRSLWQVAETPAEAARLAMQPVVERPFSQKLESKPKQS